VDPGETWVREKFVPYSVGFLSMGSTESYCVLIPRVGSGVLDGSLCGCNLNPTATGNTINNVVEGGVLGVEASSLSPPNSAGQISYGKSRFATEFVIAESSGKTLNAKKFIDLQRTTQSGARAEAAALKAGRGRRVNIGIAVPAGYDISPFDVGSDTESAGNSIAIGRQEAEFVKDGVGNSLVGSSSKLTESRRRQRTGRPVHGLSICLTAKSHSPLASRHVIASHSQIPEAFSPRNWLDDWSSDHSW